MMKGTMRTLAAVAAMALAAGAARAEPSDPSCAPAKFTWSAVGSGEADVAGKDSRTPVRPVSKEIAAPAFIMTIDAGEPGVYQLSADFDVKHLSQEAVLTLAGATSAIPGRAFDVRMAAGDDGSSTFSRPVETSGKPFRVELRTSGTATVTPRVITLCRLR